MHVPEDSHRSMIPMNHSNKDRKPLAENEEGRLLIEENTFPFDTYPTQSRTARVPRVGKCADKAVRLAAIDPKIRTGCANERGIAAVFTIAPDVPVALRIVQRGARLLEPGVLIGGVVQNDVHDDADAERSRALEQVIKIADGAVLRIDGLIMGDVIPEIDLRRRVHGRDPDRVDAKIFEVTKSALDSLEIAFTIPVGVLEAAWIDLVDNGVFPPGIGGGGGGGNWLRDELQAEKKNESTKGATHERY